MKLPSAPSWKRSDNGMPNDGAVLAAVVMPDHAHVLFELGDKLTVGRWVGRWKSAARRALSFAGDWQRDFWEHRLRAEESVEDYGLYIFLNPYRAGPIPPHLTSQRWWAPTSGLFRFLSALGPGGTPPPEWLEWPDQRFSHLSARD